MSNPTTPFSWQMPTATDLVTDLPADFEVFGQAVATSMADLLGGTTGQILSKTSATDMDFTWTTPNPGDITGVTAGVGISGGGTSGDVTVTNSMATAMTTSGDLIQATGSGTFARLGTGTNGQYLTTNGTTNSWGTISAGGMTLLSTTTLTGASVTVSSISTAYNDLYIVIKELRPATDNTYLKFQVNGLTSTNYYSSGNLAAGPAAFSSTAINLDTISGIDNGASTGLTIINVPNYANTTTWKIIPAYTMANDATTPTQVTFGYKYGFVNTTSAITSFTFLMSSGNFTSGTVLIYGVK